MLASTSDQAQRALMSRAMAFLWLAGSILGAVSLLLPHSPETNVPAIAAIVGVGFAASIVMLLTRIRMTVPLIMAATACGTLLVSAAIYLSEPSSPYSVMFLWVALFGAFFLPGTPTWAQLGLIAVAYGTVLALHSDRETDALARWLITVVGLVVAAGLMSALVQASRRSERERRRLATIVESSGEAILGASKHGTIESWNRGAELLLGYSALEMIGRPLSQLMPTDRSGEMDELIAWPTLDADIDGHETVWRRKDGESIHVALTIAVIPGAKGEPAGVSLIAYDISEQKHVEQLSERLLAESEARARTDPLTGLANRRAWDEELHRELARGARQGWPVCVAMIDLDHFKAFNDERGHLSGDELLAEAATTWRVELRDGDFIARYGGEEFGVLLPNCSIGDAAQVVERLRATTPMGQTCSAGLARWDGSESAAELLRRTDAALYAAKRAGRDRLLTG